MDFLCISMFMPLYTNSVINLERVRNSNHSLDFIRIHLILCCVPLNHLTKIYYTRYHLWKHLEPFSPLSSFPSGKPKGSRTPAPPSAAMSFCLYCLPLAFFTQTQDAGLGSDVHLNVSLFCTYGYLLYVYKIQRSQKTAPLIYRLYFLKSLKHF